MRDDRARGNGRDLPFTGRESLNSPPDLWEDFFRTDRREAPAALTGFQITIGVLVALGFLILAFHVAGTVGPQNPPPPTIYQTPTATTHPVGW